MTLKMSANDIVVLDRWLFPLKVFHFLIITLQIVMIKVVILAPSIK